MLDTAIVLRLVVAVIVGGLLGLNRELHGKPAGFRTYALVCLGAATATVAAIYPQNGTPIDPNAASRVMQGVLTGIGFLGAGVIIHDSAGHVSGLTTAATIWICAVLGFVCAVANWRLIAVVLILLTIALTIGAWVEHTAERLFHRRKTQKATTASPGPQP